MITTMKHFLFTTLVTLATTSALLADPFPIQKDWGTLATEGESLRITLKNGSDLKSIDIPRLFNPIGPVTLEPGGKELKFKPGTTTWNIALPPDTSSGTVKVVTHGKPNLPSNPPAVGIDNDGSYQFPAHLATTHGEMLRYEPQPHKNTIGYWVNENDHADWQLNVKTPGRFHVEILQGCGTNQGGSLAAVSLLKNGEITDNVEFTVQDTGHFQNFIWRRIGTVALTGAKGQSLRVHALKKANKAVMDVRKIRLVPAPARLAVWPGKAPGEPFASMDADELKAKVAMNVSHRVFGVENPTITLYKADKAKANGTAVVVCPGGAYNVLALAKEGTEIAHWFNSIGVTAAVLEYRVPRRSRDGFHLPPLQDAQRAIRLMRQNAAQWDIDPDRIGVLGFSAGGHLTVMTATHWNEQTYKPVDKADQLSARPDFILPIYPAYLGLDAGHKGLSPLVTLSEKTPPTFVAVTWDDKMRGADAALLLNALKKNKVPMELHVFAEGGHGYGLRPGPDQATTWPALAEVWLRNQGLLKKD